MEKKRILVVDDEQDLCEILKFNLEEEGYDVSTANSAEEALAMDLHGFQLILLDVMMGEISGFAMAKQLKADETLCNIPIIFLTARDSEDDTLTGFNLGADDYIPKPFSIREVIMRVKAVLRRSEKDQPQDAPHIVSYNTLKLDVDKKMAYVDEHEVALTKTEFDLLHMLLTQPSHVFSRQDLIKRVWPQGVMVLDRTVDVNITRLRKKVAPYGKNIVTRLGFGYFFEE